MRTLDEVVQCLRELQRIKPGDPNPAWFRSARANEWGSQISELAGEAADYIESLLTTQSV